MTSEVSHENDAALACLSLRMLSLEISEAACETWRSLPIWRGTDLSSQPGGALSSEGQLPAMGLSHFSCILQSSFELFQLKLLEQRCANFLEQSFPTEPCLNFRFMSKINQYYDPSPLGFGVDCYTIMHSQDNTHTHTCISGQLSVLFSILRIRQQIRGVTRKGPVNVHHRQ